MNVVANNAADIAQLTGDSAAIAAVGFLDGAKVHLFQANIPCDRFTDLATLFASEATYVGYASQTVVWDVPSVSSDGTVELVGGALTFRPTNAVTPNTIWGLYVTNAGSSALWLCGQFDNPPIPMDDATKQIVVVLRYRSTGGGVVDYAA